ncbi:hypothetical protein LIER_20617 [Lithospermum erythrorhizon]|uniref:Uncharacterized protein n=1 Tax=Lithospermum erythrorhizon TaxID=34254 RepID=A0AAV3QQJ8_LITER
MVEGVPRIWTLKEEARGLPPSTVEDLDSVAKLSKYLHQGENKCPWYTFCDEAMLVAAEEISSIAGSTQPQLVSLDDMLMDRPSLFTPVAIITKTKPRESLLSEAVSSSPPPTTTVPIPAINPFLKRMATAVPSVPPPKKAKKARDSSNEESQSQEIQPIVGEKAHLANIVTLDSSTTIYDRDAVNGAYALARRSDHLAIDNNSLRHKAKGMENAISLKTSLNQGLNEECKDPKAKLAQESRRVEELSKELIEEREATKI